LFPFISIGGFFCLLISFSRALPAFTLVVLKERPAVAVGCDSLLYTLLSSRLASHSQLSADFASLAFSRSILSEAVD
jgi:hypothetical protein